MSAAPALLLDLAIKASLLCLAGLLLAGLSRRRSAALRHDLWMAIFGCCALLPVGIVVMRLLDPALPVAPVHDAVMAVAPRLPEAVPAGTIELVDRIWSGDGGGSALGWVVFLLAALWLAGAAVEAVRIALGYSEAAAIVRAATPFAGADVPRGARLLITDELPAPAVFGVRSPAILLPVEAFGWPAARLRAVLAHEAAHVERRDCAFELIVQLACAMHWYNPLVWRAARSLRAERELACDDRVVAAGLDPRAYASALVEVARGTFAGPKRALLAMARPPELERRVRVLLGPRRPPAGPGRLRRTAAGAAVMFVVAAGMLTAPASGLLGAGSVQPGAGPYSGIDDPMSELVPLDYEALAPIAASVPAAGPDRDAIAALRVHLDRESRGYGDLVRQRATWALSRAQSGRLFDGVAPYVGNRDWRLRAYAAWALAATADARATPLLTPLLDDPVWRVRAMAAASLARIADPRAADAMLDSLDDPAWQVRLGVVDYVGRVGDPTLIRRLEPLLRDPHMAPRSHAEILITGS